MQSYKRIPKRSLIGSRVSAPWSDGRFYCGTVESMTEQPNGQYMYSILFDDGYQKLYFHKDIVGQGFNTIAGVFLKYGQKVYISYHGREVAGVVVKHNKATNEVLLEVECSNGEAIEMVKRLEDIRLMESRKSTRLNGPDSESRGMTKVIDVPRTRNLRRRRHTGDDDDDDDEHINVDSDMQLAAVALQKLSCSPASPHFPLDLSKSPHSWSDRLSRKSPSPPLQQYSFSAPHQGGFFGSASTDEGIEVDDMLYPIEEDVKPCKVEKEEDSKSAAMIRYKCTWKGCRVVENDCDKIEHHIRSVHLGTTEDNSDHEEEFYYEEIEMSEMDVVTSNMEVMTCASPTQSCPLNLSLPRQPIGQDHDYNRKEKIHRFSPSPGPILPSRPILIPGAAADMTPPTQHTPPTPTTGVHMHFPQNSPYSRQQPYTKMSPLSPTIASPKHTTSGRKRSDIKKCRKVYGMENRDLWCTQCKWKKACTRFVPEGGQ